MNFVFHHENFQTFGKICENEFSRNLTLGKVKEESKKEHLHPVRGGAADGEWLL